MSIFECEYLKPQVKDTDFTLLLTTQIAKFPFPHS